MSTPPHPAGEQPMEKVERLVDEFMQAARLSGLDERSIHRVAPVRTALLDHIRTMAAQATLYAATSPLAEAEMQSAVMEVCAKHLEECRNSLETLSAIKAKYAAREAVMLTEEEVRQCAIKAEAADVPEEEWGPGSMNMMWLRAIAVPLVNEAVRAFAAKNGIRVKG